MSSWISSQRALGEGRVFIGLFGHVAFLSEPRDIANINGLYSSQRFHVLLGPTQQYGFFLCGHGNHLGKIAMYLDDVQRGVGGTAQPLLH